MSIVRLPAAQLRTVRDLLASEEPGHKDQSRVSDDRDALDELPQGALMLLAQLQPLRELPLQLSLPALRSGAGTESTLGKVSEAQPMHLPMKPPCVPSSPALVNARLAKTDRLPITAQVLVQAPIASALASPDQAAADASAEQKAPLSSTRLPLAMPTQVPGQTAVASALSASDQAAADASAEQKAPLSSTRLPLAMPAHVPDQAADASAPRASDQDVADTPAEQKPPLWSTRLPLAMPAHVPDQTAIASAPLASDQPVGDRLIKQETPQALPAQPLPVLAKSSYLNQPTRVAVPAKATAGPNSAPEANIAREAKNYLQVPFSKGDAVGLITVSKAGAERPEQLLLNPSSALVFSYLSDNLAQAPDARWRLTDQQGHECRQGQEPERPDEEVEEPSRQALRERRERGEHQT